MVVKNYLFLKINETFGKSYERPTKVTEITPEIFIRLLGFV